MSSQLSKYKQFRKRVSEIIEVGYNEDIVSRAYDVINLLTIVVNICVSVMLTFYEMEERYGSTLLSIEAVTVGFFAFDLILRLWTAGCIYTDKKESSAVLRYIFSFNGIIDILSCVPYYLPVFFPAGMATFRIFRVMRIFRIFRLNAYFDSLSVIGAVIRGKAKLLMSSVFIIVMLMLAASLTMYSIEHNAQPEVFRNAFSGLWWAAATLLTVGYGDIYPITTAGKLLGIVITMLGVGLVAIPTGIISAGFVEVYEKMRSTAEEAKESDVHFIKVQLAAGDEWTGKQIKDLHIPRSIIIAAVQRGREVLVPRGNVELMEGDLLVLGVEGHRDNIELKLKELELKEHHPWNGQKIKDLDLSRQSFIVMVRRKNRILMPHGDTKLLAGDVVLLYTKQYLQGARSESI